MRTSPLSRTKFPDAHEACADFPKERRIAPAIDLRANTSAFRESPDTFLFTVNDRLFVRKADKLFTPYPSATSLALWRGTSQPKKLNAIAVTF